MVNKTTKIGAISASAVGLLLVSFVVATGQPTAVINDRQEPQYPRNAGLPAPSPITGIIARQEVSSFQEAKSRVGYDVKAPSDSDLPAGYETRLTTVEPDIKIVTMLISPEPIEKGVTTDYDFFYKHKGILVFMEEHDPTFDKQAFLQGWSGQRNATSVKIGSYDGAIHEILTHTRFDQFVQEPAELVYFKGDVLVELRGMVPGTDLIKAAESMG